MKEEIKNRIETVSRGDVPEGYKLCESAPIPEDWDAKPLSRLSKVLTEPARDREYETLSISAGIGFVNQAEKFGKELSGKQYEKYTVLCEGDFAYNKGNSKKYPQGCTYQLVGRTEAAVPNVFECFRMADVEPTYYAQLFINGYMNHQLARKINHGIRDDGLLNLTEDDFFSTVLPIPPLPEQQKIAEILATCDKVIELKRKLIEEKRRQKKWLMQKLLNPDSGVRLLGFEGSKWENVRIEKLGDIITGSTPSRANEDYWNGPFPWISAQDFNGKYIGETKESVTELGMRQCRILPKGTVLVTCIASIGLNAITTEECATNQQINAIVCSHKYDNEFVFYAVENISDYLQKIAGKTAVPIISKGVFSKMEINVPISKQEQISIAETLSGFDNAIEKYEQELAAWQQKKKALMQLLLTGLVRVKV